MQSEQIAGDLLKVKAVFLRPDEPFTWASGIKSPIYCDNRLTLTDVAVRTDVENALAQTIRQSYPGAEVLMLGIAAVGAVSAVIRNYFASRTSQTIGKELRQDMYRNVQRLSLENIDRLQPASIITRITNDVTQIQDFINSIMKMLYAPPPPYFRMSSAVMKPCSYPSFSSSERT